MSADRCFYFNQLGGFMSKIADYFKGVKKEVARIKWTSKKDLLKYSISTISFMLFFGVYFYLIDMLEALLRSKKKKKRNGML